MTMHRQTGPRQVTSEARGVVATPERVGAWIAVANAGDEFVYATRLRSGGLLPGSEGMLAMRALSDAGLVILFQRAAGDSEARWRNYVARRTQQPMPVARPAVAEPEGMSPQILDGLYQILSRRAALGRPCPSMTALAGLAGLGVDVVTRALAVLVEEKFIRIERAPAPTARFVTIVATGQRTGVAR